MKNLTPGNRETSIGGISKITTKVLSGFRREENSNALFFDIVEAYDKIH